MSYDDSGARHAVRDYYEGCTFIDADFPVEGREIGPCRKCQRPIWIDAPFCGHCYYDPAVEQAKYAAQLERARAKQMEIYKLTAGGFVIGFLFLGLPSGGFFEFTGTSLMTYCAASGFAVAAGMHTLFRWAHRFDERRARERALQ